MSVSKGQESRDTRSMGGITGVLIKSGPEHFTMSRPSAKVGVFRPFAVIIILMEFAIEFFVANTRASFEIAFGALFLVARLASP